MNLHRLGIEQCSIQLTNLFDVFVWREFNLIRFVSNQFNFCFFRFKDKRIEEEQQQQCYYERKKQKQQNKATKSNQKHPCLYRYGRSM